MAVKELLIYPEVQRGHNLDVWSASGPCSQAWGGQVHGGLATNPGPALLTTSGSNGKGLPEEATATHSSVSLLLTLWQVPAARQYCKSCLDPCFAARPVLRALSSLHVPLLLKTCTVLVQSTRPMFQTHGHSPNTCKTLIYKELIWRQTHRQAYFVALVRAHNFQFRDLLQP